MTKEDALQQIKKEFATAEYAQSLGNDGMVRVCARRAAGIAISFWLQTHPRPDWGMNAMNQLRSLQLDGNTPQAVRGATERLSTKVTEQFTSAFPTNPIEDSKIVINHFLEDR